jgi:hypothetical protein
VELSVVVLLPDGLVAPDAGVYWRKCGSAEDLRATFAPPALKVVVAPGGWLFGATRGSGNEALGAEADVDTTGPEPETTVELRLVWASWFIRAILAN